MKPAISQVCSLNSPWEKDVEDYAAGACHALEIWLGKLETYLETHSIEDVLRILDEHQMATPVASYQGGLLMSQGAARQEHWEHFGRRLELCRRLGIVTLVVAADLFGTLSQQDLDRVYLSLAQATQQAAEHGLRLALEFQSRASLANNLETCVAIINHVGNPNLGVCLDVFHYYLGPSKLEDLAYLSPDNLFHVQLSDVSGRPRELATDSDRILPGDGDFSLQPILTRLTEVGYDGYISLELMNPILWQVPARQLAEVGMTALRKLLGQASMGSN